MQASAAVDDHRDFRREHNGAVDDRGAQRCGNCSGIDQRRIVGQRIDDDRDTERGDAKLIDFGPHNGRRRGE